MGSTDSLAPRYICPFCGRSSFNVHDIEGRYCACCGSASELLPKDCEHRSARAPKDPWTFKLDGHTAVPATVEEVGELWPQIEKRRVARDVLPNGIEVSTVFTGIRTNLPPAAPDIFETAIFGGSMGESRWKSSTWAEAEETHRAVVALVKARSQTWGDP